MATTFLNLQNDVINALHPAIIDRTAYSTDEVKRMINRMYFDFIKRTKLIKGTIDVTTVANQASYTSSDAANLAYVYEINEVRMITDSDNGYILMPYPGGHANLPRILTYSSLPGHFWTKGIGTPGEFEIGTWPIHDTTGDTLRIETFLFPTSELSNDSDEPVIEEQHREALAIGALWKLYRQFSYINKDWIYIYRNYRDEYMEMVAQAELTRPIDTEDGLPEIFDVTESNFF